MDGVVCVTDLEAGKVLLPFDPDRTEPIYALCATDEIVTFGGGFLETITFDLRIPRSDRRSYLHAFISREGRAGSSSFQCGVTAAVHGRSFRFNGGEVLVNCLGERGCCLYRIDGKPIQDYPGINDKRKTKKKKKKPKSAASAGGDDDESNDEEEEEEEEEDEEDEDGGGEGKGEEADGKEDIEDGDDEDEDQEGNPKKKHSPLSITNATSSRRVRRSSEPDLHELDSELALGAAGRDDDNEDSEEPRRLPHPIDVEDEIEDSADGLNPGDFDDVD
eukprot:g1040.t1